MRRIWPTNVGAARHYPSRVDGSELPSNSGVNPNAAQDGAAGSPGRRGSLPAPPALSVLPDIGEELVVRFDRRLLAAVILLAWLAGFVTAMLLFWEPGARGAETTAREAQVERYEGMGR